MEAADPIQFITPKQNIENEKIDFIEELKVIKENENYKIQFGLKENKNDLTIKVISENSKDIYYFQQSYTLNEFQHLSKIFVVYETAKDTILFLKNLKFEIIEKDDKVANNNQKEDTFRSDFCQAIKAQGVSKHSKSLIDAVYMPF